VSSNGADDRRGLVRGIRDARNAYKGPFTGAHVRKVIEDEGYEAVADEDKDEFLIFVKPGCAPIPVNPNWDQVWENDPVFKCLRRDLRMSHRLLLTNLNRARGS
jgi:hypothetical protein